MLAAAGDVWWLGLIDALLCSALATQGRRREVLAHVDVFEATDLVPDRDTLVRRPLLRFHQRPHARLDRRRRGRRARRALAVAEEMDLVLTRAEAELVLAEVLEERVVVPRMPRPPESERRASWMPSGSGPRWSRST